MTRGWAWAALVAELLVPISVAASIAYVLAAEAAYDPERDGFQEAWEIMVVMVVLMVWVPACVIVALVSAVIGTVRSRRHRHVRQAPAVAVIVWVVLGVFLVPFAALVLRTTALS